MSNNLDSARVQSSPSLPFIFLAGFTITLLAILPEWSAFSFPSLAMDEGFLLEYPARILSGALPNRDFMLFHGPTNYYLIAVLDRLFGCNLAVERGVGLFYHLSIPLSIFAISLRWTRAAAVCAGLSSAWFLGALGPFAYAWLGTITFFLWSVFFLARAQSSRSESEPAGLAAIAGTFFGISWGFRLELIPVLFISVLPLFLRASKRLKLSFLVGMLFGLLPLVGHVLAVSPGAVLANFALKTKSLIALREPAPLWINAPPYALVLPILSAVITLFAGVRSIISSRKEIRSTTLLSLGLFSAGIVPQAVQCPEWSHLLQVECVTFALLPVALVALFCRDAQEPSRKVQIMIVAGVIFLALLQWDVTRFVGGTVLRSVGIRSQNPVRILHQGRDCIVGSQEEALEINSLLEAVDRNVRDGARIFMFPKYPVGADKTDLFLYYLLPRLTPASFWMYVDVDSSTRQRLNELMKNYFEKDLAAADALILRLPDSSASVASPTGPDLFDLCPSIKGRFSRYGRFGNRELYLRNSANH